MNFSEKSIVVTGGAGFIGSHLCTKLISLGAKITVIDNFNDFYDPEIKRRNIQPLLNSDNFVLKEGDIRDSEFLETVFNSHFDVVVHLAAMAGVRPSIQDPQLYNDVNIVGTTNLLEQCYRKEIEKFVFGSSSSVYGINSKVPFSEDDNISRTISPYAATKLAGEAICHTYHHLYGLSIVSLRFFTVYGPRQRPEMAIHKFMRLIHNGEQVPMFGDGASRRDYTYVADIVDGIVGSIELKCGYEIFNLGNSRTITLSELIEKIEQAIGTKALIEQFPDQPGDVPITYADISKSTKLLGYHPNYPLEKGLANMADWFLNNITK